MMQSPFHVGFTIVLRVMAHVHILCPMADEFKKHIFLYISADHDWCQSEPCQNNGTCVDKVNDYECLCTVGFEGQNCEIGMYNDMAVGVFSI